LVKKRMTVEEYLEHQPEEEMADFKRISSILDSEMEVWFRVHWRLSEELFLFWYIWLKDNTAMVEGFVEEMKAVIAIKIDDKQEISEPKDYSANFDVSD